MDTVDFSPQKKKVSMLWKIIKRILLAAGLLSITLNIIALFDTRPFRFKHLYPEQVGQAFFKLRYPLTPDLSLSSVLQDLKKAGAQCDPVPLHSNISKDNDAKAIRCIYQSGSFSNPSFTDYIVDIYLSAHDEVRKIEFHIEKHDRSPIARPVQLNEKR